MYVLMSGVYHDRIEDPNLPPPDPRGAVEIGLTWPAGWVKLLGNAARKNNPQKKESGFGLVPCRMKPGSERVLVQNYLATEAVVLDLDKGLDGKAPQDIVSELAAAISEWGFCWWETWNSKPGKPRLRIVFPLMAPVNGKCALDIWEQFVRRCPYPVDPTSKERKRVHLLPVTGYSFGVQPGPAIDPGVLGWTPSAYDPASPAGRIGPGRPKKPAPAPVLLSDDGPGDEGDESDGSGSGGSDDDGSGSGSSGSGSGSGGSGSSGAVGGYVLTGDEQIEHEGGDQILLSDLDRAWVESHCRPGEDRARVLCPFRNQGSGSSGSASAFIRVHDSRAYLTCTSGGHGHTAGQTWVFLLTKRKVALPGRCPFPYSVGQEGELIKQKTSPDGKVVVYETVCAYAPLVTALYCDAETGDEWWRLEWTGALGHKEMVLRRDDCATAQRLSDRTARAGLSIHEANRKELTVWLSAYVVVNQDTLPRFAVCSRMGWFADGFQWGRNWLDLAGSGRTQELVTYGRNGEGKLADACTSAGTFAGWASAFRDLIVYPLAAIGVVGSVASVLYSKIPGTMAHLMEWGAANGTGKTASMRMAESVWAQPEEFESSWDMSNVGFEEIAGFLCNLPMFLDDTKTQQGAKNRISPDKTVYRVVSGEGAVKGAPGGGTVRQRTWSLGAFSSGEESIYTQYQSGGMRARLVSIQDTPFGLKTKDKVSALVAPIARPMSQNYGWLGPACVRLIWSIDPTVLEKRYTAARDRWQKKLEAGGHTASDRSAIHLANLSVAALLIEAVLRAEGLDGGQPAGWVGRVVSEVAAAMCRTDADAGDVDPAIRAQRGFWSYIVARRTSFWCASARDIREVLGKWEGGDSWTEVYFSGPCLGAFLREEGYALSVGEATKRWAESGFICSGGHRGRQFNVSVGGAKDWFYRLKRESIDRLLGDGSSIGDDEAGSSEPLPL